MIEKILLLTLKVLFLTTFFTRNLIVKKRTGQPIRTRDWLVLSSILLSVLCFFVTIFSIYNQPYLYNQKINVIFGGIQCIVLMITVFISIFKPWKKKKSKNQT